MPTETFQTPPRATSISWSASSNWRAVSSLSTAAGRMIRLVSLATLMSSARTRPGCTARHPSAGKANLGRHRGVFWEMLTNSRRTGHPVQGRHRGGAMARMLQRGATIAIATTAVVLGGSGLALGATTHAAVSDPITPVTQTVDTVTSGLAPAPRAQTAPTLPGQKQMTSVVGAVLTPVKSTLAGLTAPEQAPR